MKIDIYSYDENGDPEVTTFATPCVKLGTAEQCVARFEREWGTWCLGITWKNLATNGQSLDEEFYPLLRAPAEIGTHEEYSDYLATSLRIHHIDVDGNALWMNPLLSEPEDTAPGA